jgi:AraC-like DNA-binding protein
VKQGAEAVACAHPSETIDMGCGVRVPMRSSRHAAISSYTYSRGAAAPLLEKRNRAHMINVTIDGRWLFKNGGACEEIVPGIVVVGARDDRYACGHSNVTPNHNLIATLADSALDGDAGPIFGQRIFEMSQALSLLRRACAAADDEQFDSRMFEIFHLVSATSNPPRDTVSRHFLRVQRMKRFIELHAAERITLSDIAASVGMSPFVCLRLFKRAAGLTPNAYLAQCRLSEALRLLRRANVDIRTVAQRSGFGDQAYFARVFKNYMGLTPTEYRRRLLS